MRKLDTWHKRGKRASIRCATMINTYSQNIYLSCKHITSRVKSIARKADDETTQREKKRENMAVTSGENIATHFWSRERACLVREKYKLPRIHTVVFGRVNEIHNDE